MLANNSLATDKDLRFFFSCIFPRIGMMVLSFCKPYIPSIYFNNCQVTLLITDGAQTWGYNGPSPADIAETMRNRGIEIQVIGIGSMIAFEELLPLVSSPGLLRTAEFSGDSLSSILQEQVRSLCRGKIIKILLQTVITTFLSHPLGPDAVNPSHKETAPNEHSNTRNTSIEEPRETWGREARKMSGMEQNRMFFI